MGCLVNCNLPLSPSEKEGEFLTEKSSLFLSEGARRRKGKWNCISLGFTSSNGNTMGHCSSKSMMNRNGI